MVVAGAHPRFASRGAGCRIRDVDGYESIDLMCTYGPIVLGHRHPAVTAAARALMHAMGTRLRLGIEQQAASRSRAITYSDPPAIPFLTSFGDVRFDRGRTGAVAAACAGVYLTPHHNWFLSAAHRESDIDRVLDATDAVFASVRHADA